MDLGLPFFSLSSYNLISCFYLFSPPFPLNFHCFYCYIEFIPKILLYNLAAFWFLNPYYYFNPLQFLFFLHSIPFISVNLSKSSTRQDFVMSLSFRFPRYSLNRKFANRQVLLLSKQYYYTPTQKIAWEGHNSRWSS